MYIISDILIHISIYLIYVNLCKRYSTFETKEVIAIEQERLLFGRVLWQAVFIFICHLRYLI